jgi:conjugative transfer signal peptidase TraF
MNSRIYSSGLSSAGPVSSRQAKAKKRPLFAIAVLALGVRALTFPKASIPSLLWNLSPSVPVGLYRLTAGAPLTGVLAVIRLPEPFNTLASTRGYLPAGALLIKRVAAGAGDLVCRHGALVTINGRAVARARPFDSAGQPLPRWSGCISLGMAQIFVLSADPDSFDSRYIRAVNHRDVLGAAVSVWVRRSPLPTL